MAFIVLGLSRGTLMVVIGSLMLGELTMNALPATEQRFGPDRFAIGFWVHPRVAENIEARYAEIAEANFTVVLDTGRGPPETLPMQVKLCEKYHLKAIIAGAGLPPDQLLDGPACWG